MSVTGRIESDEEAKDSEDSPSSGTTKRGLGKVEGKDLETQEALTPPPSDAPAESIETAAPSDEPSPQPSKARKLSAAQRAVIAERTAAILKKARPGSKEYADACVERAEAGLAVPVMKKTAVDMLALEQYQETHGDEIRKATRVPRYGVWMGVTLGVITVGTVAYVFLGPSSAASRSGSPSAAATSGTARPLSSAPVDVTPAPIAPLTAAEATTGMATATAASTAAPTDQPVQTAPTVRGSAPLPRPPQPPPTSAPTTLPTSAPATTNGWAPAWKAP